MIKIRWVGLMVVLVSGMVCMAANPAASVKAPIPVPEPSGTAGEEAPPIPVVSVTARAVMPEVPMPERRKHFWMMQHERFHKLAAKGGFDVMFLGDSITSAWLAKDRGKEIWDREIAPLNAANFGASGECTQNVLWRFEHGELEGTLDPKVLVFLLGTNNTGTQNDKPEEIAAGVGAILKTFHARFPKAKILLLAILPRSAKPLRINNENTNKLLAKFDGFWNIKYLDIGQRFLEPNGQTSHKLLGDGLHPTAAGYQVWADAIVPEIKAALAK